MSLHDRGGTGDPTSAEGRRWTLRQRVVAMCLLIGVLLTFLTAGATVTAVANRGQLDNLLDRIGPMRTSTNNILAAVINQETAVRGYVVNGNAKDIAPYEQGVATERTEAAAIMANPAATATVRSELAQVRALADQWRAAVAVPAVAAVQRGDQAGARALLNDSARDRFDRLRAALGALQATLQRIRDDAVNTVKDTSSTLLDVLIAAAGLVLASAVALVVAVQRAVVRPVTDLAAQVRLVAQGDYDHTIDAHGPPELANLAGDVDRMRRRIAADLTEVQNARHQLELAADRLEQQAAELTRSNRDLEQFAYVASHDLQEPLRKVSSFCQLLQRRYQGQLDERADQYIAFAVSGAQRMQRLINDLLAFSRIGRATTGFTEVDLGRVVAEVANARTIDVMPDGSEATPAAGAEVIAADLPTVRGEEVLLTTLFSNLLGNSLKFRRPGVPPRVEVTARPAEDGWEISVVDNGIGIEQEYADKVFIIFQRLHPRDAYPGTGIGLAVAKKIVEYHGGRIWIDVHHEGGTAIRFTLPTTVSAPLASAERVPMQREEEPVR